MGKMTTVARIELFLEYRRRGVPLWQAIKIARGWGRQWRPTMGVDQCGNHEIFSMPPLNPPPAGAGTAREREQP